jgi:hypothetical protein
VFQFCAGGKRQRTYYSSGRKNCKAAKAVRKSERTSENICRDSKQVERKKFQRPKKLYARKKSSVDFEQYVVGRKFWEE